MYISSRCRPTTLLTIHIFYASDVIAYQGTGVDIEHCITERRHFMHSCGGQTGTPGRGGSAPEQHVLRDVPHRRCSDQGKQRILVHVGLADDVMPGEDRRQVQGLSEVHLLDDGPHSEGRLRRIQGFRHKRFSPVRFWRSVTETLFLFSPALRTPPGTAPARRLAASLREENTLGFFSGRCGCAPTTRVLAQAASGRPGASSPARPTRGKEVRPASGAVARWAAGRAETRLDARQVAWTGCTVPSAVRLF